MEKYTFYYTESIGGNKYKETIVAENFRKARNEFFSTHQMPHRLDHVLNETTHEKLK